MDAGDSRVQAIDCLAAILRGDGVLPDLRHRWPAGALPAEHVRRPAISAESPTLRFTHMQFEALLTTARKSSNPRDFALVATLGLLGLRIFEGHRSRHRRLRRRTRLPVLRVRQRHQGRLDPAPAIGRAGHRPRSAPTPAGLLALLLRAGQAAIAPQLGSCAADSKTVGPDRETASQDQAAFGLHVKGKLGAAAAAGSRVYTVDNQSAWLQPGG